MKGVTGIQKLIEEIVDGLIAFIYNTIATFVLILFRPVRSSHRNTEHTLAPHITG